ncbi:hypothetical protein DUI87_08224 [Hirundo rustica rustica]|uniref:Uncharacterized protein n=1 Tax=Hirundo rustica rustica TaxID=333673 RepID=A0A3M0L9U4_HIRRU|nr:hypothetical protein DUI87_08224 [Hirundo rustica rustica]
MMTPPPSWQPIPITLSEKNFILMPNLNVPWHSLKLCPLVSSLVTWEKRLTPTWMQPSFKLLYRVIRSLLNLFFSKLNTPAHSAAPHRICVPDPSPALVPFSGHTPASQYPSDRNYGSWLNHCYEGVMAIMAKLYKEATATKALPSLKMPPKGNLGL